MLKKALVASLFVALLALLYGCGQNTSVNTTIAQPVNLTVMGTVYRWEVSGANNGIGIINHWGDPAANAYVTLDGNGQTFTTITNNKGEYKLTGVPDGIYQITITMEGVVHQVPARNVTIKPAAGTAADGTVVTVPPLTWFDEYTYITSYSPAPNSIISNNQVFSITFVTPMDTSTVRIRLVPQGIRALADSGDSVATDLTWSTDEKTVTITPLGSLTSNEVYRLQVVYNLSSAAPNQCYPLDKRGAPLYITALPGGHDILTNTADYKTPAGGTLAAPTGLQVAVNNKITSEITAADVLVGANTVKLSWLPVTSGTITGYRVYVARSGSVLEYVPLESSASTSNISATPYFTSNITKVIKALFGSGAQLDAVSLKNYPFINYPVYFKVVAFNGDGESAAIETSAKDSAGPTLGTSAPRPYGGAWLTDAIHLMPIGAGETTRMYFAISEPVDLTTLVAANFTLTGGLTVSQINCLDSGSNPGVLVGTIVEVIASGNLVGQTLTMGAGVKDLAGNPVKVGTGDTVVLN